MRYELKSKACFNKQITEWKMFLVHSNSESTIQKPTENSSLYGYYFLYEILYAVV